MKHVAYMLAAGQYPYENRPIVEAGYVGSGGISDTPISDEIKSRLSATFGFASFDEFLPGDTVKVVDDVAIRVRADHGSHILADSSGIGEHPARANSLAGHCHAADGHAGGPAAKAQAQADFAVHLKDSGWSLIAVSLSAVMKTVAGTDNRDELRDSNDDLARAAAKLFFADAGRTYPQLREFAADLLTLPGSSFIGANRLPDEETALAAITARLNALKRGWADLGLTPAASARVRILTAAGDVDSGYDEVAVDANAEHLVMLSPLVAGKLVELRPGNDRLTTFAYSDSGDPEIVEATTLPSDESVEFAYETSTVFDPATATWSATAPLFSQNAKRVFVRLAAQAD